MFKTAADGTEGEVGGDARGRPLAVAGADPGRLHGLVARAAAQHGARTAVRYAGGAEEGRWCYTYRRVVCLGDALRERLQLHCDFSRGYAIGLYCQPTVNLPSCILGILQAGAAFCPVDPESSPRLSAYFIQMCKLKYILVQKDMIQKFRDSLSAWLHIDVECDVPKLNVILVKIQWLTTDVDSFASEPKSKENVICSKVEVLKGRLQSTDKDRGSHQYKYVDCCGFLAYILQTSGTTGAPKIVRVPHQCIVPNIQHLMSIFDISSDDVVFMASPLTFDPSIIEIFMALCSGATLLIVPPVIKMMPKRLTEVLFSHHKVSVMQATPTLIKSFGSKVLTSVVLSANSSLRVLALGGEPFPSLHVLKNWREEGNKTQIFNLYGITEVSCWATYYKIHEETPHSTKRCEDHVPLGFPLLGTILDVVDDSGKVVHEGEGQVFIGGEERVCFLNNEVTVSPGIMRATGDWVIVKDGLMYYLGRKDNQIKRHGKRVNLESIQQVAESLKEVEACVMTKCDQDKMVLFVVPRSLPEQHNKSSTNFCRGILSNLGKLVPSHAIPDDVVPISSIPFTAHGKIDQTLLTQIYQEKTKAKNSNSIRMLGRKEIWEGIHRLWKVVLDLPEDLTDPSDDCMFLYSGGDSLKALRLVEEIETFVGQRIFGLTEVILYDSFLDIYNYISNAILFGIENKEELDDKRKTKRKKMKDKSAGFYSKQINQWKSIAINGSITTISRGSRITKLHTDLSYDNSADRLSIQKDNELMEGISNREEKKELNFSNVPEIMNEDTSLSEEKTPDKNNWLELFESQIVNPSHTDGKFIPDNRLTYSRTVSFEIRWKSDTAKCVDASPLLVISGNDGSDVTVYIGSHSHRMQAIDVLSGEIKWERILGDRIESSACMSRCGNFIIVGCYDGLIYVLRSIDGETYWTFCTQNSVKSSPIVDPDLGLVFIGSHDQHVYALDILDKVCAWKLHCGGGAVFSTPCLNKSPRLLYVGTLGDSLVAVNPDTGSAVWKRSCGKPLFSSPQCTSRSVYIGCVDGSLHCFGHNGDQLWQFSTGGPIFSSPCIFNFSATDQKIIFGSYDSFVYCLNEDGNLAWKFETTKQVKSSLHQSYGKRNLLWVVEITLCIVWRSLHQNKKKYPWVKVSNFLNN
ncbi:beta-alanine-activating enzyme isoform X2 [Pristis pectinata]|uniref:beta-alanine-activating enzyme isoform X2 n=1 Tax=Pristis pectinata TaxID=685728 RepID=UPI00223CEDF9|nr:beta-alanine-activating enzyme isoform X2 [Pristis pectinata]